MESSKQWKEVAVFGWVCSQPHPPILQGNEAEDQQEIGPQTMGGQPTAKQPHRVRRERCVRHLRGMEENRNHQRRFEAMARGGGSLG